MLTLAAWQGLMFLDVCSTPISTWHALTEMPRTLWARFGGLCTSGVQIRIEPLFYAQAVVPGLGRVASPCLDDLAHGMNC